MGYRLDDKGKYYTTHVTKRAAQILAYAQGTLVSGTIHLTLDHRVKDELNLGERFVAITRAQVRDFSSGQLLHENDVLVLNKDQIVWLLLEDGNEPAESGHQTPGR